MIYNATNRRALLHDILDLPDPDGSWIHRGISQLPLRALIESYGLMTWLGWSLRFSALIANEGTRVQWPTKTWWGKAQVFLWERSSLPDSEALAGTAGLPVGYTKQAQCVLSPHYEPPGIGSTSKSRFLFEGARQYHWQVDDFIFFNYTLVWFSLNWGITLSLSNKT